MSTNIVQIQVIKAEGLMIQVNDVERLKGIFQAERNGFTYPECSLMTVLVEHSDRAGPGHGPWIGFAPSTVKWSGEGSGHTWQRHVSKWGPPDTHPTFIDDVAPCIRGTLEAVVIWEGGYPPEGLRIVDGIVTQPKVGYTLAD